MKPLTLSFCFIALFHQCGADEVRSVEELIGSSIEKKLQALSIGQSAKNLEGEVTCDFGVSPSGFLLDLKKVGEQRETSFSAFVRNAIENAAPFGLKTSVSNSTWKGSVTIRAHYEIVTGSKTPISKEKSPDDSLRLDLARTSLSIAQKENEKQELERTQADRSRKGQNLGSTGSFQQASSFKGDLSRRFEEKQAASDADRSTELSNQLAAVNQQLSRLKEKKEMISKGVSDLKRNTDSEEKERISFAVSIESK